MKISLAGIWSFFILSLAHTLIPLDALAQEKVTLGWVEKVRIFPGDLVLHAKLDTGADYSSINASDMKKFVKNGKSFVSVSLRNRYGRMEEITREVVRTAKIKREGTEEATEREVIRLGVCLGGIFMEEQFNLANRSNFDYQVLIGRSFLTGNVIIDPSITYTVEPNCENVQLEEVEK